MARLNRLLNGTDRRVAQVHREVREMHESQRNAAQRPEGGVDGGTKRYLAGCVAVLVAVVASLLVYLGTVKSQNKVLRTFAREVYDHLTDHKASHSGL